MSGFVLKVPYGNYTFDSFLECLRRNCETVFGEEEKKKWFKVHTVLHTLKDWKRGIFSESEVRDFGDVAEITIVREGNFEEEGKEEVFYGVEYEPGLVLFFTSAILEGYEKTLERRIDRTRGATQAWISSTLFQMVWQSILEHNGGYVHRFTSRRGPLDNTPALTRPSYERRINYTGEDGTQAVKELQTQYGVSPESMYLMIRPDLQVQITNRGFFSAKAASPMGLDILLQFLDLTTGELLESRRETARIRFDVLNAHGDSSLPHVASITAGRITLHGSLLTADLVREFFAKSEEFSFLDTYLEEGSLGASATVVDEIKGSVFDISMTEKEVTLVPKYNTTFESFFLFFRSVAEQLDEGATLHVLSTH